MVIKPYNNPSRTGFGEAKPEAGAPVLGRRHGTKCSAQCRSNTNAKEGEDVY